MGLRPRTVLAFGAGGIGAAGLLGAVLAERVVRPRRAPRLDHQVLATRDGEVVFVADDELVRPGRYGIYWPGGHAVIGPVLRREGREVVRSLEHLDEGRLGAASKVGIGHVSIGDPRRAHGYPFSEVGIESEVGTLPCWVVPPPAHPVPPAAGSTWALLVHGYGGSTASTLDLMPIFHHLGLHVLALAYRNDPGAPRSPDHRYHLGASEWRDLDAAMAYALANGAARLLLVGWSMGGAIVMQAYANSERADRVCGIVLDCPVLDWRAVLAGQARRRHLPAPVLAVAIRVVESRIGAGLARLDWTDPSRAREVGVPVLVLHGEDDTLVPLATSRAFAAGCELAELEVVPFAGHFGSWNVDPGRYSTAIERFWRERAGVMGGAEVAG